MLILRINEGENWQKIKNSNIKPFDITDLKPKLDKSSIKDNQEYFSIQIAIPNGRERILKIKANDNAEELAENFCKVYGLKEEIKQRLTQTIEYFMKQYLYKDNDSSNFLEDK